MEGVAPSVVKNELNGKATLPKADYEKLHEVEKHAYRPHATDKDVYEVDLEGDVEVVPKGKVEELKAEKDEFRDNNRSLNALKEELERQLKSYDGIDPAEHQALKVRVAELEGKAAGAEKAAALEQQLAETQVRHEGTMRFLAKGGHADAVSLFGTELLKYFTTNGKGEVVAKTPGAPTLDAWIDQAMRTLSFLFKPSRGGGAHTGTTPAGGDNRPVIPAHDPLAFGQNIESIAAGKAVVR